MTANLHFVKTEENQLAYEDCSMEGLSKHSRRLCNPFGIIWKNRIVAAPSYVGSNFYHGIPYLFILFPDKLIHIYEVYIDLWTTIALPEIEMEI